MNDLKIYGIHIYMHGGRPRREATAGGHGGGPRPKALRFRSPERTRLLRENWKKFFFKQKKGTRIHSSSLSLKFPLRESGCRIGYEPTEMSRDHFWRSISRDTDVEFLHYADEDAIR